MQVVRREMLEKDLEKNFCFCFLSSILSSILTVSRDGNICPTLHQSFFSLSTVKSSEYLMDEARSLFPSSKFTYIYFLVFVCVCTHMWRI